MSANEDKIKADKFALIYEFNNRSPLFTRVASKFLENGEPEKALPILEDGIKNYRTYPTAIILYSLALAMVGNKEDAYNSIEKIRDLFSSNATIDFYKAKIDSIKEAESPADYHFSSSIFDKGEVNETAPDNIDFESNTNSSEDDSSDSEEDLEALAQKLSNASIPMISDSDELKISAAKDLEDNSKFPGKSLVSETLAKIYFNQGNYNEALSIYETLVEIQPEKSDYYKAQIDKINEQKSSKQ